MNDLAIARLRRDPLRRRSRTRTSWVTARRAPGIIRTPSPDVELYSVRVLGANLKCQGALLLAGIEWVVAHGMHVVNLRRLLQHPCSAGAWWLGSRRHDVPSNGPGGSCQLEGGQSAG